MLLVSYVFEDSHFVFHNVGKSTTASMLAYVLKELGDDLTAVVGAEVPQVLS